MYKSSVVMKVGSGTLGAAQRLRNANMPLKNLLQIQSECDIAEFWTHLDLQRDDLDIDNYLVPSRLSSMTWSGVQVEKRPLCPKSTVLDCGGSVLSAATAVRLQGVDSG